MRATDVAGDDKPSEQVERRHHPRNFMPMKKYMLAVVVGLALHVQTATAG